MSPSHRRKKELPSCQVNLAFDWVNRLEVQLAKLRLYVFASNEWRHFVHADSARLTLLNIKTKDEIQRSVFSKICQSEENRVLTSMRRYLALNGFKTISLMYDGLIVLHDLHSFPDVQAMSDLVKSETGYTMRILDKPLFNPLAQWPQIVL